MDTFTASSKLLDLLGTLIGFSTIMLLLSLIVTSMVQFIQSLLQLRARNLARGVAAALEDAKIEKRDAFTLARKLLVKPMSANRDKLDKTPGYFDNVSWIEPSELKDNLKAAAKDATESDISVFEAKFKSIQAFLRKRFALHSRIVSVCCAALIAIAFQVNALDLLRDLSVSPELRNQYLEGSEQVLAAAENIPMSTLSYQEVSDLALSQIGVLYPEVDTLLEEVSGVGSSREQIVEELRSLLEAVVPDRAGEMTAKYEDLLEDLYRAQAGKALDQAERLTGQIAYFNLDLLPNGWTYYGELTNWLGLLISIVLVSLGSPFWFKWLATLSGLKDVLKREDKKTDGSS